MSAASPVGRTPDAHFPAAVIVTVLTRVASAQRAATTFLQAHATGSVTVVIVDDLFGTGADHLRAANVRGLEVLPVAAITIGDDRALARLALAWEPEELWRAVRPAAVAAVLHRVLESHPMATLLVLPDDAEVEGSLLDLFDAATTNEIALVATRRTPTPRDGRLPDEKGVVEHGLVDPDLLVVGPASWPFLRWWADRVAFAVTLAPARMRPPQENWLDQALAAFDVHVIRSADIGVSYLNADEPGRADQPRLLRYPGFDPLQPWRLSVLAAGWPRVLLSESSWLARRCRARTRDLSRAHALLSGPFPRTPSWRSLPSGARVDRAMRSAYLHGLLVALGRGDVEPPNGFVEGEEPAFVDWLNTRGSPDDTRTRYLAAIQSIRPDLEAMFPGGPSAGADLGAWARITGRHDGLWWRLVPADPCDPVVAIAARAVATTDGPAMGPTTSTSPYLPPGINVTGLLRAELGIGAAGRLLLKAVAGSGEAHVAVVDTATVHEQRHQLSASVSQSNPYDVNVVAINADALPAFARRVGPEFFAKRYTVGLWFWEMECFPDRFSDALELVDEIWVASEHVRAAIAQATTKPVLVIPLGAESRTEAPDLAVASALGVAPDCFCVLYCFDYASVAARKNPFGAVEAFCRAFPAATADGPRLVLKSISGRFHLLDQERLRALVSDRPDIVLIERFTTPDETMALMARADAYLSLHRAEGWGLTLADAMAFGTPVIATGYSGNLEFMNDSNSWLVPFELASIPDDVPVYATCGRWAEPDLDAAATMLRVVFAGGSDVRARAQQASADVRQMAASDAGARFVRDRLQAIRANRPHDTDSRIPAENPMPPQPTPVPLLEVPMTPPAPSPATTTAGAGAGANTEPRAPVALGVDQAMGHPGLGPVHLDVVAPPEPETRSGVGARLVTKYTHADQNHLDQLGHARTVALVQALESTRAAINGIVALQRADQTTLTRTLDATVNHVHALQRAFDALTRDHGELHQERRVAESALASRLTTETADIKTDLARIEAHLAELTHAVHRLVERDRQPD